MRGCKFIVLCIFILLAADANSALADNVKFQGGTRTRDGNWVTLEGKLTKPQGPGSFPAVVLLHGCGGITEHDDDWAKRLAEWGYVVLQVDSLGPRGESNLCVNPFLIPFAVRVQDAYDGRKYLAGLSSVIPGRIAVMGWSHGGIAALAAVSPMNYAAVGGLYFPHQLPKKRNRFQAAIAFYPYCTANLEDAQAPLLILIGDTDDWTPAELCRMNLPKGKSRHEVSLKVYPGAYHAFDWEGTDMLIQGHRLQYDPAATADAIVEVQKFLEKHLK